MSTDRILSAVADWTDEEFALAFGFEREPAPTTDEDRHYVVGLPVAFTVHANGAVTIDVDLSEAEAIDEDEEACERYGAEVAIDSLTVSDAAARLANTLTITLHPTAQEAS